MNPLGNEMVITLKSSNYFASLSCMSMYMRTMRSIDCMLVDALKVKPENFENKELTSYILTMILPNV